MSEFWIYILIGVCVVAISFYIGVSRGQATYNRIAYRSLNKEPFLLPEAVVNEAIHALKLVEEVRYNLGLSASTFFKIHWWIVENTGAYLDSQYVLFIIRRLRNKGAFEEYKPDDNIAETIRSKTCRRSD